MSDRVTNAEMDALLEQIRTHAITLDLLPASCTRIWYTRARYGTDAVEATDERSNRIAVSFLPEFTMSVTKAQAYRELTATSKVLAVLAGRKS